MIILATSEHLEAINVIYNQAVQDGLRTAHIHPFSMEERTRWFYGHSESCYPIFVYLEEKNVVGWLSLSPYRADRQALDEVVEVSYYVDYDHHGKGIGSQLMQHAITCCEELHYRIMVAILVNNNRPSIALLEKFDFNEGGRIPDAIHYQQEFRDHLYMYKNLSGDPKKD